MTRSVCIEAYIKVYGLNSGPNLGRGNGFYALIPEKVGVAENNCSRAA